MGYMGEYRAIAKSGAYNFPYPLCREKGDSIVFRTYEVGVTKPSRKLFAA
jgi:hypothetical protein